MRHSNRIDGLIQLRDRGGMPLAVESGRTYPAGTTLQIETSKYRARVATEGYVSGVAAGSFEDRATGARDLGFGLSIADFLLEPADPAAPIVAGQYQFGDRVHGNLPKRYVEGPQICTQARELPATVFAGVGFVAVRLRYRWQQAYPPRDRAGSVWEQTLIFPEGERFFLSADRVTTVSESPALFLRIDMPGHIKHRQGMGFEHVYLSYHEPQILPSTEFQADFAPDERFLYRRGDGLVPARFVRAYQVRTEGKAGPWLAGMTLRPDDVYQAWCHQRGYVCLIAEIGGRATRPGTTFGACHLIGWFDDIAAMEAAHDRHRGWSGLEFEGPADRPTGYRGLTATELTPVST